MHSHHENLGNKSRGGARLVLPVGSQHALRFVVASQTVNSGLDQNQTEFTVLILAVALQVLADGDSLLDHVVQILWDVGLESNRLHYAQNFVAVNKAHLGHTVRVTQDDTCNRLNTLCFININITSNNGIINNYAHTDFGGSQTLLAELLDLILHILGVKLQPRWDCASVGKG